jgi:hypothetical protein
MAKSKALIAAEAKIAALEARIAVAKTVYMSQKARIAELEAALNTRGVKAAPAAPSAKPAAPVVTQYTDHCGRVWEKVRVGNRATSRQVGGVEVNEVSFADVAQYFEAAH